MMLLQYSLSYALMSTTGVRFSSLIKLVILDYLARTPLLRLIYGRISSIFLDFHRSKRLLCTQTGHRLCGLQIPTTSQAPIELLLGCVIDSVALSGESFIGVLSLERRLSEDSGRF